MKFDPFIHNVDHFSTLYMKVLKLRRHRFLYHSPLAQSFDTVLILSDSNRIRTHNHLVCKRTLNHLNYRV